ncbi:MAG: hypothetical protein JWM27_4163 [Gemmatimonadetes bacterium]|nr:hypothetical protein [Gemmatimonadota bacterium]
MSSGGLSRARLARMHDVMAGHVESGSMPGLVTLVARRGEVHVDTIGTRAVGGAEPMRRDTLFRIASLTKPVAAAAAMVLVEECRLRLDEPVDELIPELAGRRVLRRLDAALDDTVPANRPITARDLLTLRMGLGYAFEGGGAYPIQQAFREFGILQGPPHPQAFPDMDEWMRRVGTLPLMYQPGERWQYDLALDVLGVLVARAAGQPLDVFLRERVLEPLGMRDTAFHVPPDKIGRFATSYAVDPETGGLRVFDEAAGGGWSRPPAFAAAASGLVSTADDFLAFGRMMLDGRAPGGERILSRHAIETMTADHLTSAQKAVSGLFPGQFDATGYGFGLSMVTRRGGVADSVGSFGWTGGLGTLWFSDPREELVGILLTQRGFTSPVLPPVAADFRTLVYAAIDD